jgi:2-polyprenyl-6-methoxyphenol hydroxylase-like FAD-dependent oxidoreductase
VEIQARVTTDSLRTLPNLTDRIGADKQNSVTLIGDAAHLMTPFAGVGVNAAMEDALHLARTIIGHKTDWNALPPKESRAGLAAALREYEEAMFVRAEDFAKQTWMYLGLFFHERGGIAMVEHFEQARAQEKATGQENVAAVLEALA